MAVFLIAQLRIHDRNRYAEYESGFMEIFSKYEGQLLSVDEETDVLEGEWDYTRTVLITFPSKEKADAWFYAKEYQALAEHRKAASLGSIVVIKGLESEG